MTVQSIDAAGQRPLTILIVDDSAMMRAMIKRVAGLADVPIGRILEAADGQQALEILEAEHVDALFTDINMPVMTGTELLREIASRAAWPDLVRVIISTDGSISRREEVRNLSVHHYIEKPFSPEVMRDVLDAVTRSDS
jgi:two-component system, chemotaxis family, chemotaxis protein CheY